MRIIAIDPGFERLGIAIIERATRGSKEELIFSECFKTSLKLPIPERLHLVGGEVRKIISEYKPQVLAIETIFLTSNQKTVIAVAEARGIIIYEAARAGLPVFEYSPLQIKQAITGYGRAGKDAVSKMIKTLMPVSREIKSDDAIDAIAVGLTAFAREKFA